MKTDDDRFQQLLVDSGLTEESDATLLKMRLAFIVGSGQSVDASAFRRALGFAADGPRTAPGQKPCECHGKS